eukprot:12265725-Alexandrium_andersonii.AAC.1
MAPPPIRGPSLATKPQLFALPAPGDPPALGGPRRHEQNEPKPRGSGWKSVQPALSMSWHREKTGRRSDDK